MTTINRVTCLQCDWTTTDKNHIESANFHGECRHCAGHETVLRWDYADGNILLVDNVDDERVILSSSDAFACGSCGEGFDSLAYGFVTLHHGLVEFTCHDCRVKE